MFIESLAQRTYCIIYVDTFLIKYIMYNYYYITYGLNKEITKQQNNLWQGGMSYMKQYKNVRVSMCR